MLLLLALRETRLSIASHVVYGNCPVNKLLEMFSTCIGTSETDELSSCRFPVRQLKLTSSTTRLLEAGEDLGPGLPGLQTGARPKSSGKFLHKNGIKRLPGPVAHPEEKAPFACP